MTMNVHDIPGTHSVSLPFSALAASAASIGLGAWKAPFICSVTGLRFVSQDAITGAATNYAQFDVTGVNAATTVRGTLSFDDGSDAAAGVDVTMASVTTFDMAAGDILKIDYIENGTGNASAIGGGCVTIEYEGR